MLKVYCSGHTLKLKKPGCIRDKFSFSHRVDVTESRHSGLQGFYCVLALGPSLSKQVFCLLRCASSGET